MASDGELLYVGTGRFVAALDAETGEERWRTKLKGSTTTVVTMLLKGPHLFAGHRGRVYCLDADTGAIMWKNDLPKLGYDAVLLTTDGVHGCMSQAAAAVMKEAQAAA